MNRDELITVLAKEPDGQFSTFDHWVTCATRYIGGTNALCVDVLDRICRNGADFMRARDELTFPVRFYHGRGGQTEREQERNARRAELKEHPWRKQSWA